MPLCTKYIMPVSMVTEWEFEYLINCVPIKNESIINLWHWFCTNTYLKAVVMSLESRTTGSGCVFCLICVEKSVGGESELSTASRHCFGLGGPSLSITESCSSSDSVAEQSWSFFQIFQCVVKGRVLHSQISRVLPFSDDISSIG